MDELEKVQQQIAELQKKADELAKEKKASVISDIKAKIKSYGITAKDLGFASTEQAEPAPTKKVKIKYRKGEDTWTGRGLKPKWVKTYLDGGGKLEDIQVE